MLSIIALDRGFSSRFLFSDEDKDVLTVCCVRTGVNGDRKLKPEVFRNRDKRKPILLRVFGDLSAKITEAAERVALGVARDVDDLLNVAAVSDLADQQPVDPKPSRVQDDETEASLVLEVPEKSRNSFDIVPRDEVALVPDAEEFGVVFGVDDVVVEPDDVAEPVGEEDGVDADAATDVKENRLFRSPFFRVEG